MRFATHLEPFSVTRTAFFLCFLAAGVAVAVRFVGSPKVLMELAGAMGLLVFALKSLREPLVFVSVFLLVLILLPPFFLDDLGSTPLYISTLLVPVGLAVSFTRLPEFELRFDSIAKGLMVFLLGTGLSLPFGWWLSGTQVGNESLLRWLMLAQTVLAYLLIRGGTRRRETRLERWLVPILMIAAVVSAAYGIVDFLWPIPLPHPAADQYIWLRTDIMRRAQGVFYEAGNFANLCAFFLVVGAAALLSKHERTVRIPLVWLAASTAILSLAVFVSFTRSTWVSVLIALLAFVAVSRQVSLRRGCLFLAVFSIPVVLLWFYSSGLWDYLLNSRLGNLSQLFTDPNLASSGRFDTWKMVLSILESHPQYLLFGVGYKTLPFTRLFHETIITDNGFLNLLLETGIIGLGGFLYFSTAVFSTFLRMRREGVGESVFWGAVLFSFWCGEWAQMVAVDAYTYWRNMAVFLAVMGFALNRAERTRSTAARD